MSVPTWYVTQLLSYRCLVVRAKRFRDCSPPCPPEHRVNTKTRRFKLVGFRPTKCVISDAHIQIMEIARSVYPTYGLDLSRMVLGENTPKYQPFINERFSTYNGEPFAALYPQGPHFVAISFFPVRLSFRLYLPSANHPADQLQIVCCLDTYTRPKGRASANRLHDLARGTRKQKNSRGLLVHRCRSRAAC